MSLCHRLLDLAFGVSPAWIAAAPTVADIMADTAQAWAAPQSVLLPLGPPRPIHITITITTTTTIANRTLTAIMAATTANRTLAAITAATPTRATLPDGRHCLRATAGYRY